MGAELRIQIHANTRCHDKVGFIEKQNQGNIDKEWFTGRFAEGDGSKVIKKPSAQEETKENCKADCERELHDWSYTLIDSWHAHYC